MKAVAIILAGLLTVAAGAAQAQSKAEYNIYVTNEAKNGVPLYESGKRFACQDKIYAVVEISNPGDTGRHVLYATWRNPSGEDQEHTEYPFQLIGGNVRIWVWLKLHRDSGFSMFQGINPTGGLEEFAGQWQLKIRIDDTPVARKRFELVC